MLLITVDKIYHMIHGNSKTFDDCYREKNFKVIPISTSPVVKYLEGDVGEYLSQSHLFNVRESSIRYHLDLYESGQGNFEVFCIKRGTRYIVCDGMHRSSVLFFKGHRVMEITVVDSKTHGFARFENFITDDTIIDLI
jgi:hypothetical protein